MKNWQKFVLFLIFVSLVSVAIYFIVRNLGKSKTTTVPPENTTGPNNGGTTDPGNNNNVDNSGGSSGEPNVVNIGAIVGGILGGLALLAGAVLYFRYKKSSVKPSLSAKVSVRGDQNEDSATTSQNEESPDIPIKQETQDNVDATLVAPASIPTKKKRKSKVYKIPEALFRGFEKLEHYASNKQKYYRLKTENNVLKRTILAEYNNANGKNENDIHFPVIKWIAAMKGDSTYGHIYQVYEDFDKNEREIDDIVRQNETYAKKQTYGTKNSRKYLDFLNSYRGKRDKSGIELIANGYQLGKIRFPAYKVKEVEINGIMTGIYKRITKEGNLIDPGPLYDEFYEAAKGLLGDIEPKHLLYTQNKAYVKVFGKDGTKQYIPAWRYNGLKLRGEIKGLAS